MRVGCVHTHPTLIVRDPNWAVASTRIGRERSLVQDIQWTCYPVVFLEERWLIPRKNDERPWNLAFVEQNFRAFWSRHETQGKGFKRNLNKTDLLLCWWFKLTWYGDEAKHMHTHIRNAMQKEKKSDEKNKVSVLSREGYSFVAHHVTWIRSLNT